MVGLELSGLATLLFLPAVSRRICLPSNKFLEEFRRLSRESFPHLYEDDGLSSSSYLGGQADLTPLKNRAREAIDALTDAQRAADNGKVDDAVEALRRAKSAIEAALGGQIGPYGYGSGSGGTPR